MAEKTRHEILDGMEQIVENEMMRRDGYIFESVRRPDLKAAGAICGGHQACMVGALYLAAGKVTFASSNKYCDLEELLTMPPVAPPSRHAYLVGHPEIEAVYDAMNRASEEWAAAFDGEIKFRYGLEPTDPSGAPRHDWMEALFEAKYPVLGKDDLLAIVARAREILG